VATLYNFHPVAHGLMIIDALGQTGKFYTVPAVGQGWMPAKGDHGGGDVWMPRLWTLVTNLHAPDYNLEGAWYSDG
jgi:hypothetical protein